MAAIAPQTGVRRILLVCGARSAARELLQPLGHQVEIREAHTFGQAVEALRHESFDLVISEQGDFLALERASATQQSAIILDALGQGVCIIDAAGRIVWANGLMRSYPAALVEQVCEHGRRTLVEAAEKSEAPRARHFSISTPDDRYFELTVTPIVDAQQRPMQAAAVAWDVTRSRRAQKKIDALDMAGRELVDLYSVTAGEANMQRRLHLLEEKLLRYMRDLLNFDNFAVMLLDKKTNRLDIVLQHGMADEVSRLDLYASTEGNGISGYVAATGRSYICPDTSKDPRYLRGLDVARSSLTVPLRLRDQVVGVFDIESDRPAAFNEDDRQFAEILGRYIATALSVMDLLVLERYTITGRLADDVSQEIAGPLNDILTTASTLMEEYIGHDDLRNRLGAICEHVASIRTMIRKVGEPSRSGMLGRPVEAARRDPRLDGKRVLVADDEDLVRETISGVLTKFGCVVETASDGNQAAAMLARTDYDLVLADIKMPHRNGYEVFAAARERRADVPVILITGFGYDPNHSIVRASREGLSAVLFKPFKVDQLLAEVRKALRIAPAEQS